jgi:hypothetical protein
MAASAIVYVSLCIWYSYTDQMVFINDPTFWPSHHSDWVKDMHLGSSNGHYVSMYSLLPDWIKFSTTVLSFLSGIFIIAGLLGSHKKL